MKYIELFAGCGGLSLGLQAVGFKNIMVNELSPMASETYAYNFYNEELTSTDYIDNPHPHTVWLSSQYSKDDISLRLREDPRDYPDYDDTSSFSDVAKLESLKNKLVVGNIKELNRLLSSKPDLLKSISQVDVVSGGPPCQSFSMAGLRELSNDRNSLPWEFMQFVKLTNPKIAVLENVSGILRAFKSNGKPYYAWFEIAKGFASLGYVPICLHVNAKLTGIAQNRTRFILIALRIDVYEQRINSFNPIERSLMNQYLTLYENTKAGVSTNSTDIEVIDLTKNINPAISNTFLSPFFEHQDKNFTVKEVIDDLKITGNNFETESRYLSFIGKSLNILPIPNRQSLQNHELRANSPHVKRRFRIYQILNLLLPNEKKEVNNLMRGKSDSLSESTTEKLLKHGFLMLDDSIGFFENKDALIDYLIQHATKKNSQKALIADMPAPSALSIPDDVCHYDENELRTLTVREMARIQSFPDSFVFKSKVTTGGKMRKFEVPQYTQVGNAVPPLLGVAIGKVIKNILS